jgi:signal peptidase I
LDDTKKIKDRKPLVFQHFWTILGTILCIFLIPILVINCTLIAKSYLNNEKIPDIGGRFPMIVLTDSMYPSIQSGDLIICHTEDPANVKAGDVISFFDPAGNGSTVVTHRVVEVTTDENGGLAWITKGDANNTEDANIVPAENLAGVYSLRIHNLGSVAIFMQTTKGLIICVVCPILLLVIYDMVRRKRYEKSRKKDTDALLAELEALRAEKEIFHQDATPGPNIDTTSETKGEKGYEKQ